MRVVAIIQARMCSSRLPGKVLLQLEGKTMLEHVINRVRHCSNIDDLVVATSINKADVEIVKLVSSLGERVYVGSEDDVLDRYYQSAMLMKADIVVRITADCPITDHGLVDELLRVFKEEKVDYLSNNLSCTFPEGLSVEIMSFTALEEVWQCAREKFEREHVTPYIINNPSLFKTYNYVNECDNGSLRLTVDYKEDFELIEKLYKELYLANNFFGLEEVLNLFKSFPEMAKINGFISRGSAYIHGLDLEKYRKGLNSHES